MYKIRIVSLQRLHKFITCSSETALTGESQFQISAPLVIEPGSLMTGSKQVDRWTSGTVYECSKIAGSAQCHVKYFHLAGTCYYIFSFNVNDFINLISCMTGYELWIPPPLHFTLILFLDTTWIHCWPAPNPSSPMQQLNARRSKLCEIYLNYKYES